VTAPVRHPRKSAGAIPRRELAVLGLLATAAAFAAVWGWSWNAHFNDYGTEAAPSFNALLHGHLLTFLQTAPAYGASLLIRAPFALPGSLAGGGELLIYRLSALPCVLALGILGVWLACDLRRGGAGRFGALLVLVICAANPITYRVLELGHPEELLGAALCVAAVLLAQRGHVSWAALGLGLAIANKQWALLAVGPVLLAAPPDRRWRTLAIAGGVAIALLAPLMLASSSLTAGTSRVVVSATGTLFHPWQIFWFFGSLPHTLAQSRMVVFPGYRIAPAWIDGRTHPLIVGLGVPATWLAMRRGARAADALPLLALLLLLRCWLDPWDVVYYPLPFIVALAAWETTVARRAPVNAALATAATWLIFWYLPNHVAGDAQSISFLIPSTVALAFLTAAVYRLPSRRLLARFGAPRLTRAPAVPS
jgi:hypothetical protein